jgi:hypothetical protein
MGAETYYPWVPSNEADWHLMAAAPDLLAALKDLLEHIEGAQEDHVPVSKFAIFQATVAIKKAEAQP